MTSLDDISAVIKDVEARVTAAETAVAAIHWPEWTLRAADRRAIQAADTAARCAQLRERLLAASAILRWHAEQLLTSADEFSNHEDIDADKR